MTRTLHTQRLDLTPWSADELPALVDLINDPFVLPYVWDGTPMMLDHVQAAWMLSEMLFRDRGYGLWTFRRKGTDVLAGYAGLRLLPHGASVEAVYACVPSERGRGLTSEAVEAVLEVGFAKGLPAISASIHAANEPSRRLLERLGMEVSGTEQTGAGELTVYSITAEKFRERGRNA